MGPQGHTVLLRDAGAPTITASGSATGINTAAWRSRILYTYVANLTGTSATIRFTYAISPNHMTGVPPSLNAGAKWATRTAGATYSSRATGLRVIAIAEGAVDAYSRVGWTVSGSAHAKASIWLGLKH
jgi:hypothetical protein